MRRQVQDGDPQVQVATLAVAIVAVLVLAFATVADAGGGRRGPRGPHGFRGHPGPAGESGQAGQSMPGLLKQNIAINWQNGQFAGRDRQSFTIPGIGSGEVRCNPVEQLVRVFPADQQADVGMWTTRLQRPSSRGAPGDDTEAVVRWARRGYFEPLEFSGPDFYESMRVDPDKVDPRSTGTFVGQISSAGKHSSPGGPGPRATSFMLSWHWNFEDGNPRCYVAGSFYTGT